LNKIFVLFFLCIQGVALAQPGNVLKNSAPFQTSYSVLAGNNYTFEEILTNNNLPFINDGSLKPQQATVYWLKITIANPKLFAGVCSLFVDPDIDNTFYYFDANQQKWIEKAVGTMPANVGAPVQNGAANIIMQPQAENTVFVKMDVRQLRKFSGNIQPAVEIEPQAMVDRHDKIKLAAWLASIAVLFFFLLSNFVLFHAFRDKSVLFYLFCQAGGIIYLTAYRELLPLQIFTVAVSPGGNIFEYGTPNFFEHIGLMLIFFGLINFARAYLGTKKHLPRMDRVLTFALYFYLAVTFVLLIINTSRVCVEQYTVIPENAYLLLLTLFIMCTAVVAYTRKLRASGTFLVAFSLTLVLMVGITIVHIFISLNESDNWLPNLVVVSEAFIFSTAIVTRTRLIQKDLRLKELEAQQLTYELREMGLQHSLVELENQKITGEIQHEKTRNELLQQTLEANQRELASVTLYMVQKNELLARLKAEIAELNKLSDAGKQQNMKGIQSILQTNLFLDDDWAKFKLHFEQVHPHFFENLQAKHPGLTKNEIRLYAYFHINLTTKEIATLLNIEPSSVRQAKMRLFKKIGQPSPDLDDG
jgi:DNA-binding NarL/FixJ family response regulator